MDAQGSSSGAGAVSSVVHAQYVWGAPVNQLPSPPLRRSHLRQIRTAPIPIRNPSGRRGGIDAGLEKQIDSPSGFHRVPFPDSFPPRSPAVARDVITAYKAMRPAPRLSSPIVFSSSARSALRFR
jgi:hypothetical protein